MRGLDFEKRNIEPEKRMCGGAGPMWVTHRFPIKGGKNLRETVMVDWSRAMCATASRPSFFARKLTRMTP